MALRICTFIFVLALAGAFVAGCSDDDDNPTSTGDEFQATIDQFSLGPLPAIPYPDDNKFGAERVALGRLLFFDPIIGGESAPWVKSANGKDPYRYRSNDVACATCHHPTLGFADGRRMGAGVGGAQFSDMDLGPDRVVPAPSLVTGDPVGTEPRNSPSILNAGLNGQGTIEAVANSFQFMDGRVTEGLDVQATKPLTSRDEMAGDAYGLGFSEGAAQDSVAARVRNIPEYVDRFMQAYPGDVTEAADITIELIGKAIGAYERELITPGSPYDQFVTGNRSVFNNQEKEGFKLFFGKGLCGDCHFGPMLSDFTFRVQGVPDGYDDIMPGFGGKNDNGGDFGRFHADEVAFADKKFAFRVLTIRNVEITGPYFHSGSAGTLREVLEFHNQPAVVGFTDEELSTLGDGAVRDPSIKALGLTDAEIDAIVAFMKTTTAPVQLGPLGTSLTEVPERVPSGLLPPGIPTPEGSGPFLTKWQMENQE